MDIKIGFRLESPPMLVPWGISESTLIDLFNGIGLQRVTHGYYTTACCALGGLSCQIGFHFTPRHYGILTELEFFRDQPMDLDMSFHEFQTGLERSFGEPIRQTDGAAGFPSYRWIQNSCEVVHYVFDRFGHEEHARIRRY